VTTRSTAAGARSGPSARITAADVSSATPRSPQRSEAPGPSSQSLQRTRRTSASSSYAPMTTTIRRSRRTAPVGRAPRREGAPALGRRSAWPLRPRARPRPRSLVQHLLPGEPSYGRLHALIGLSGTLATVPWCFVSPCAPSLSVLHSAACGRRGAKSRLRPAHCRRGPGVVELGRVRADGNEQVRHSDVLPNGRLWVQPKVTCTAGQPSYSAFWVGLGGFSTDAQALEQIGTESNCDSRGRPFTRRGTRSSGVDRSR
jgi:hypothetical protein